MKMNWICVASVRMSIINQTTSMVLDMLRLAIDKVDWTLTKMTNEWAINGPFQTLDMINKGLVRKIQYESDETILHFDSTSPWHEIARHAKLLPGAMAAAPSGTKIRIRNPTEFVNWLKSASLVYESKLKRKTKKLLKRHFR